MHLGSWKSTRETFKWHEAKPNASLAFRVLSQLPKCIHNSIDAQLKAWAQHVAFVCTPCWAMLHDVGICFVQFETSQNFFPIYANISFV